MAVRKMPQNLEAEMSVLGVTFLTKDALQKVCEELTSDMFYSDNNRYIFEAIKSLYDSNTPIDVTTLKEELDKKKLLNAVGGVEYISEVIDSVATPSNIDYYIKIVKEKATIRNLINTASDIVTKAYDDEDNVTELLDNAEKNILNVVRAREASEFLTINMALRRAQEQLEELANNHRAITGIESGFIRLDKATAGFHPGELIIIAARPGMGKTAFALNIAAHAGMTTDKAIAVFNLEMPAEQLVNRMISSVGNIDGYKLQTGQMQQNDWKRYNEAMSQLAETNIYIEDNAGVTAQEIRAKCRRLANTEKGLGLVIIDYLQLVTSGGKRTESRQVEVSDISRSLKTMAMELKVPVIALAQLSRSAEKRENNEPMLADLRESGSIEQDADIVLFINRKDYFQAKGQLDRESIVPAELIVAKHRKGSTGKIDLLFELNISHFKNYAEPSE